MRLPVDTSGLAFICAGEAQPVVDYETRRPKTDENGVALYQVALVAMTDGNADIVNVKVPGAPSGLTAGGPVQLVDLVATPWSMGDRSGIAFRVSAIRPLTGGSGREKGANAA